jgi:hypothetical protein
VGEKVEGLEDHPDRAAQFVRYPVMNRFVARVGGGALQDQTIDRNPTLVEYLQSVQAPQQGGLAATGGTDQHRLLRGFDIEGDAVQDRLLNPLQHRRSSSRLLFQSLGDPHLNDGLAGDSKTTGLFVQGADHPGGEVHIHASLLLVDPFGTGQIEALGDIFSLVELPVEILSFHTNLFLRRAIA